MWDTQSWVQNSALARQLGENVPFRHEPLTASQPWR
jgi:hypothetical protein